MVENPYLENKQLHEAAISGTLKTYLHEYADEVSTYRVNQKLAHNNLMWVMRVIALLLLFAICIILIR